MSLNERTLRMLVGLVALVLVGALWFWDQSRVQSEAVALGPAQQQGAIASSSEQRLAEERWIENRLSPLPQPFSRLLVSMHKHEPQLGTDGVRHELDANTGIRPNDGIYLYDLVRQVRPRRTAEVGFAEGFSTMYLLAALQSNGSGLHVAMDPYEDSLYHGIGLQKVKEADAKHRFRFLPVKSVAGLPRLSAEMKPFDIIFIDGDHRFDAAFTDFILADEICSKDGYILLHDTWMPSIQKVIAYIEHNRADYARRPVPQGVNMAAFQKVGVDQRAWTHFVDF
jgi:predicted O-methyltransferase YrrM